MLFNVAGTILIIPFFVPVILPVATSFFPHYADAVVANGVTNDPNSPVRVLVELDILNAYERVRSYYLNVAETLAGGK